MQAKHQGFRANLELFQNREFAILWAGFTFSSLGDAIFNIARIALIVKLTGSALGVGGMAVFAILPTVIMSLTGGVLADRLDRQKLVIWANFARGLTMLVLAVVIALGVIQYWQLYIFVFINSAFYVISNPAFDALLPSIVQKDKLKNAYSLFSLGTNIGQIAGPAIGGFLVLTTGESMATLFNAISFFVLMIALMSLKISLESRKSIKKATNFFKDVFEGWIYSRKNKVLMINFIFIAFFNVLGAMLVIGLPFFVTRSLNLKIEWYGVFLFAINIGVILGGLLVSSIHIERRGLVVCSSIIVTGLVSYVLFGFTHSIWIAAVGVVVGNISLSFMNILMPTWVQLVVSDEFRGRVFSIYSAMAQSISPIGYAIAGVLHDRFDPGQVIAFAGIGIIGFGIWMLSFKEMRELR